MLSSLNKLIVSLLDNLVFNALAIETISPIAALVLLSALPDAYLEKLSANTKCNNSCRASTLVIPLGR